MSFGDKFSKFKQFSLQSVGKAEKTDEGSDFLDMLKRMKDTKSELTILHDATKKWHKREQEAAESLEALSGAFSRVSTLESDGRKSVTELPPLLSRSSAGSVELLNQFKINVIDVIGNILEIHYKKAEKANKTLDDARLTYDAANAKYRSALENTKKNTQDDIDRLKAKTDEAESQYDRAKAVTKDACQELENAKNEFFRSKIAIIANAIGEFGATQCGAAQTCLEAIQ